MITIEPLVEAAVRQFRERAREGGFSLQFRPELWHLGLEEEPRNRQTLQPWNEAPLNFVSLRSSLHYVGLEGAVKDQDERPKKRAPLTAPSNPKGEVCFTFRLTRPTTS